jgi:hypothetical protein
MDGLPTKLNPLPSSKMRDERRAISACSESQHVVTPRQLCSDRHCTLLRYGSTSETHSKIPLRQRRRAIGGLIGTTLLACVVPVHAITEQEQRARLLFVTCEQEANLAAQGFLYGDAALDAYLQSVMDRLYPEKHGEYRVRALRNTRERRMTSHPRAWPKLTRIL